MAPRLAAETAVPRDPADTTLPWIEGNQYVLLESAIADLSGEITITVEATGSGNGQWTNVAGIQIILVPEPTALLSLGIGLSALWRRHR